MRLLCRSISQKNPKWKEVAAKCVLIQKKSEDTSSLHATLLDMGVRHTQCTQEERVKALHCPRLRVSPHGGQGPSGRLI